MRSSSRSWPITSLVGFVLIGFTTPSTFAGGPLFHRNRRVVTETVATAPRPQDRLAPTGMLGTFVPTPMLNIVDNGVVGTGYSPLGQYGFGNSMSIFGPLSAFRATTAPVTTVVRGYDGLPTVVQGTSFSTPNQPGLSPYVYPTRANNYSALPFRGTSTRRENGLMWIDHD